VLGLSEREAANSLFDQLQQYGIFVVRGGELESWLPELDAKGYGPAWIVDILEKIGEDPNADGYVRPSDDHVWQFLGTIRGWLRVPERKGMS